MSIAATMTPDGRLVAISDGVDQRTLEELATATPHFTGTEPPGGVQCALSWQAVVQLSTIAGAGWAPSPELQAWTTREFLSRSAEPAKTLAYESPTGMVPYSWQITGANVIADRRKVMINDEPGPQPSTTPIWTPEGWKTLGEIQLGDFVYDRYGQPRAVNVIKHFGKQPVYRVTFTDRTSTLATGDHRWRVWTGNDAKRGSAHGRVVTTDDMRLRGLRYADGAHVYRLPAQPVIETKTSEILPVDPYLYGALLGDGYLSNASSRSVVSLCCPDSEVQNRAIAAAADVGTTVRTVDDGQRCLTSYFHAVGQLHAGLSELQAFVRAEHKHIDSRYFQADEQDRRALLAGLLDTDGHALEKSAAIEYSSASQRLAQGVAFLARTLGAVVTESDGRTAHYVLNGERHKEQDSYRIFIWFRQDSENPFYLSRKADVYGRNRLVAQRLIPSRRFESIEQENEADVLCIGLDTVDDNARVYLTDTALIPTHNTGKTATAVLGLCEIWRRYREDPLPILVICPASVIDPWVQAFRDWAPHWRAKAWRGAKAVRKRMYGSAHVFVVSYDTARADKDLLASLKFTSVVLDESHFLKNASAGRTRAALAIVKHSPTVLALTGTPITKDTADLHPTFQALDHLAWPSKERFIARYCLSVPQDYGTDKVLGLDALREPELRQCLLGQTRRVAKNDVLAELPEKVYSVRMVDVPTRWRKVYDDFAEHMLAELPDGEQVSVTHVLTMMTILRQLATGACDIEITQVPVVDEIGNPTGELRPQYKTIMKDDPHSWKIDALMEVLEERPDEQVVMFAPSAQLVRLAGARAARAGRRVGYIIGGQSAGQRTAQREAFQCGDKDLMCVSVAAGGVGITLTAARTAVFLQRPWKLDDAIQAEDRLHRIGAEKHSSIDIIDVIAKDTIEHRIRDALRDKGGQLSEWVKDPRVISELLGGKAMRSLEKAS